MMNPPEIPGVECNAVFPRRHVAEEYLKTAGVSSLCRTGRSLTKTWKIG